MLDIPDEVYFSPKYANYVSNSKLGLLNPAQGGSPTKFFEGFKPSNSVALQLGSAVHCALLQPHEFKLSDIEAPTGKLYTAVEAFKDYRAAGKSIEESIVLACSRADYYMNKILSNNSTGLPSFLKDKIRECFKYYKESTKPKGDIEEIILPSDLRVKAVNCIKNLKENEQVMRHINHKGGLFEMAILADFRITFPKDFNNPEGERDEQIVGFKMKLDHGWIDEESRTFCLNDVKTSGKPTEHFMGHSEYDPLTGEVVNKPGSWDTFHYSRQMASYYFLLREYINKTYGEYFTGTANMLVVETIGLNRSKLYNVKNDQLIPGWREFLELMKRVAWHQANGYENTLEWACDEVTKLEPVDDWNLDDIEL
jgi:hypothetical protein